MALPNDGDIGEPDIAGYEDRLRIAGAEWPGAINFIKQFRRCASRGDQRIKPKLIYCLCVRVWLRDPGFKPVSETLQLTFGQREPGSHRMAATTLDHAFA